MLIPLGFVFWMILSHDIPLEISKETTYITEPLTEEGLVDYFRALELKRYPKNMKTDENGYRILVRELGPSSDGEDPLAQQTYEKLGLDPTTKPTVTYEEPYAFLQNHLHSLQAEDEDSLDNLYAKLDHPWTLEMMPMMGPWLEKNGPALDVIAEAVRKPTFCCPMVRVSDEQDLICISTIPDMQRMRSFVRGLPARAYYHLGTGQIDKAIDDIITIKRLGRHVGRQGTFVEALMGISFEGFANSIDLAGSLEHQPTKAQLQRFLQALQNLPAPTTLQEIMLRERYGLLDITQKMAQRQEGYEVRDVFADYRPEGWHGFATKLNSSLGFDWNITMSHINWYYDNLDTIDFAERERALEKQMMTMQFLFLSSRSEMLADYLASLFMPNNEAVQRAFHRVQCCNRVQRITLAMLLYEKNHGRLPPAYTVDKDGEPLHSWRVLLLPYMGEKAEKLYERIQLDEPWNSLHNQKFHTAAVEFYQCPSAELKPGQTIYSVVTGEKTAFQPGEGKKLDQFGPESGTMILVIENHTPCNWMDPKSDLTESNVKEIFEEEIGDRIHPGIIMIGLRSGGFRSISRSIDPEAFQHGLEGTDQKWDDY